VLAILLVVGIYAHSRWTNADMLEDPMEMQTRSGTTNGAYALLNGLGGGAADPGVVEVEGSSTYAEA
jgi:hypothetical protein